MEDIAEQYLNEHADDITHIDNFIFVKYYKYIFYFENMHCCIGLGGDKDSIYRLFVDNQPIHLEYLLEEDVVYFEIK